jgi:hypothetical protein
MTPELEHQSLSESSPLRLRVALGLFKTAVTGNLITSGLDNLNEIRPETRVIIATTHLTDVDVPLASAALSDHLDLIITDMLPNHSWSRFPIDVSLKITGESNFIPLDYSGNKSRYNSFGVFNPDNFTPMTRALDIGKRVIVAAHNPSYTGDLPTKPGIAVPYLAALADAQVLPVAVRLKNPDKRLGMAEHYLRTVLVRSDVFVSVGKLFRLDGHPDLTSQIIYRGQEGSWFSWLNIEEFKVFKTSLREQGQIVLGELSALLNTINQ